MRLYHQTQKENVSNIMKLGLQTNRLGILYLSPRSDLNFGNVTLVVETGDAKLTAFEDCKDWEVLCWDNIEPKNIQIHK